MSPHTRVVMEHRTTVQRNTPVSDGGGGYTESWAPVPASTGVHCRAFPLRVRSVELGAIGGAVVGSQTRPEIINITVVLVPKGTDASEGDRLTGVTDRLGNTLYPGPMSIDAVGDLLDHRRLMVRKIA